MPPGAPRRSQQMMESWSPWFRLAITILATWRVAHLVAREDGPFDLVVRLRVRAGPGAIGRLMDCPYCLGLWLAIPGAFLLASELRAGIIAWLGIAGGAAFLERISESRESTARPAHEAGRTED